VLYAAVVVLESEEGASDLLKEAAARDFVADAFAHCKFIGYTKPALPLLEKAGVADMLDEGTVEINGPDAVAAFLKGLGALRVWAREPSVKLP
jgi:catalase